MADCRRLNDLCAEAAREQLLRCCASARWVEQMMRERPFRDRAHLFEAASRHFRTLSGEDWIEAFAHHPRIGEAPGRSAAPTSAAAWAAGEQAGAARADDNVRAALVEGNRAYEARFGRVYLVCATGKSGHEMLAILRARMQNDPDTELCVAAREQEKITRIRLEKLLAE